MILIVFFTRSASPSLLDFGYNLEELSEQPQPLEIQQQLNPNPNIEDVEMIEDFPIQQVQLLLQVDLEESIILVCEDAGQLENYLVIIINLIIEPDFDLELLLQ